MEALYSRYRPEVRAKLAAGRVAVAGLGGLGSQVALALARSGVGHLRLIDFDVVEPSNLARQAYGRQHLGRLKTEALAEIIRDINPHLDLNLLNLKLDRRNIPEALAGYPIIVEALDRPESKAELVNSALTSLPRAQKVDGDLGLFPDDRLQPNRLTTEHCPIRGVVCASGLAGFEEANLIRTRRAGTRLFICGDEKSEAGPEMVLTAPRVMIAAGHQANLVLRLLLDLED